MYNIGFPPGSSDPNPIKNSSTPDGELVTVPWLYGKPGMPEGNFDKLCYNTFVLGGFAEQFNTIALMLEQMKKNHVLTGEFKNCRERLILLVNDGTVTLKPRGKKRQGVMEQLTELRKTVVQNFKTQSREHFTDYGCMTIARYKETHDNKCPRAAGEKVSWEYHEGVWQDVVMRRKEAEGEWGMRVKTETGTSLLETVDDGEAVLRAGQLEKKFEKEAAKKMKHEELKEANVESADGSDEEEVAEGGEEKSDGESSHDSIMNDNNDDDPLLALSGAGGNKGKKKVAAKALAPGKAKQKAKNVSVKTVRSSGSVGGTGSARSGGAPPPAVMSNKALKDLDMDATEYLIKYGIQEHVDAFTECMTKFLNDPKLQDESLATKCFRQAIDVHHNAIYETQQAFSPSYWKIAKRTTVPKDARATLDVTKKGIFAMLALLGTLTATGVDVDRADASVKDIVASGTAFVVPLRIEVVLGA